jgi:hypothetical protein
MMGFSARLSHCLSCTGFRYSAIWRKDTTAAGRQYEVATLAKQASETSPCRPSDNCVPQIAPSSANSSTCAPPSLRKVRPCSKSGGHTCANPHSPASRPAPASGRAGTAGAFLAGPMRGTRARESRRSDHRPRSDVRHKIGRPSRAALAPAFHRRPRNPPAPREHLAGQAERPARGAHHGHLSHGGRVRLRLGAGRDPTRCGLRAHQLRTRFRGRVAENDPQRAQSGKANRPRLPHPDGPRRQRGFPRRRGGSAKARTFS